MPEDREFIYHSSIRVSDADLQAAKLGRKVCTIRKGLASVARAATRLQSRNDSVGINVDRIEKGVRFGDLTEIHAKAEGFNTLSELQADLRQYYRNLTQDTIMTVIWFHISS